MPATPENLADTAARRMHRSAWSVNSGHLLLLFRKPLIASLHACLIAAAWIGSFVIRLDFDVPDPFRGAMFATLPVVIALKLVVFYAFRLFQGWWKYAGFNDLIEIAKATAAATLGVILVAVVMFGPQMALDGGEIFPRTVFLLDLVLTFLLVGGARFVVRAYGESFRFSSNRESVKRVLVVGAGRTGMTIVREMRANRALHGHSGSQVVPYEPVAFVDDDPYKQGIRVDGVPVLGTTEDIPKLLDGLDVDEVLLAISTKSGRNFRRVMDACHHRRLLLKTIPSVSELIDGRISVKRIRDVAIDDLLGRDPVRADLTRVRSNTEGHVVLITGAAGSIGTELCRQIAMLGAAHLVLFERSESDLHDLELLLRESMPNVAATGVVGDILDVGDLAAAFERHRPSRVYHAAAYKHVPLMEHHVVAAVRNNVIGTYNVAMAAERFGAEQLVLISTDKAVRPTSLMGATKRAAERVLLSMSTGRIRLTTVRFGNVLGSRGSVVPIFKRQIETGGPVTVTHPDVTRYFMTIPEAVELVLQAAAVSRGGDMFHLDMGDPVRIADLAENMIRLSGFEPGRDIEIKFVGLRPGEKLYEELLVEGEDVESTEHPRVLAVRTTDTGVEAGWMQTVIRAADARDTTRLVALICAAVPEFRPSDLIVPASPLQARQLI